MCLLPVASKIVSGDSGGTAKPVGPVVERGFREKIEGAEAILRTMEQIELPPRHVFADGIYCRELLVPEGVMLTGKVHRHDALIVVHYGDISVMTEEGTVRVKGPDTFRGKAGVKRIGYAHKETLWSSVFATTLTDLDEIERELYEPEPEGLGSMFDFKTGQVKQEMLDRQDYMYVIDESGLGHDLVNTLVSYEDDQDLSPIPGIYQAPSAIHGVGVFTEIPRSHGSVIGKASRNGMRTILGRFANHSRNPNMIPVPTNDDELDFIACREIQAGEELSIDYRATMKLRGMLGGG